MTCTIRNLILNFNSIVNVYKCVDLKNNKVWFFACLTLNSSPESKVRFGYAKEAALFVSLASNLRSTLTIFLGNGIRFYISLEIPSFFRQRKINTKDAFVLCEKTSFKKGNPSDNLVIPLPAVRQSGTVESWTWIEHSPIPFRRFLEPPRRDEFCKGLTKLSRARLVLMALLRSRAFQFWIQNLPQCDPAKKSFRACVWSRISVFEHCCKRSSLFALFF